MSIDPAARCVLHPGRVALDACPVCARLRCAEDAEIHGSAGCGVCHSDRTERRPLRVFELLIAAGVACLPATFIGGAISADYIQDHIFSLVVPGLVGVAACWPALVVVHRSGRGGTQLRHLTWTVASFAGLCGVLGTAFGFRLDPGGPSQALVSWSLNGLPYVCAAGAGLLWPLIYGGPATRNRDP